AGMSDKWTLVHDALVGFVKDPKSAGLGVGLQYFPLQARAECTTDAECGGRTPFDTPSCIARRACVGADPAQGGPPMACSQLPGFRPERCPKGTRCVDVGRCSNTAADCYAVGQACPGGAAGNVCQAAPKRCTSLPGFPSCAVADYQRLAVAISALPGAQ